MTWMRLRLRVEWAPDAVELEKETGYWAFAGDQFGLEEQFRVPGCSRSSENVVF
jgi:hypothetical protein